jgi:hypothetical protein
MTTLSYSQSAAADPRFIIFHDGCYYVALGVWAYDPNAPNLSPAQRTIVELVQKIYEACGPADRANIVRVAGPEIDHVVAGGHTRPPPNVPRPPGGGG